MIIKIKDGDMLKINGNEYKVCGTTLESVGNNGASTKVSFLVEPYNNSAMPVLKISFGQWTTGISENDLAGLAQLLTRG